MGASKMVTINFKTDSNASTLEIFFETVLEENVRCFLSEIGIFDNYSKNDLKQSLEIFSKYRIGKLILKSKNETGFPYFIIDVRVYTKFLVFEIEEFNIKYDIHYLRLTLDDLYKFEFDVENFLTNFVDTYLEDK